MKKIYLILIFISLILGSHLNAQRTLQFFTTPETRIAIPNKNATNGEMYQQQSIPDYERPQLPLQQASNRSLEYLEVGETYFDVQTYGAVQNRLSVFDDGTMAATWIMSLEGTTGATDRGTGYNTFSDGTWGSFPNMRLESLRCGWPSYVRTADNKEVVISHATGTNPFSLRMMSKNVTDTEWNEEQLFPEHPTGLLWSRSTVGGSDNNSIHLIAITNPIAWADFGGAIYEGMDGKLQYFRSLDGGVSWDITEQELPGLDSLNYGFIDGDSYSITSRGDVIAIALFSQWGDISVWKSIDNGANWTRFIVQDFILDDYSLDDGYTFEDIASEYDSLVYPDSMALFTTDGSGSVLIDNNDMVHVTFGQMYVDDTNLTDNNNTYYPTTGGMSYWNQSMGEGTVQHLDVVDDALDPNGNDILDIQANTNIALYFKSLSTYPTMSVGDDGTLFLVWSGVREDLFDEGDSQHYRHLFISKSYDNGATWIEATDLTNLFGEFFPPEVTGILEQVFPYTYPTIEDGKLHLIFQQDIRPGMNFGDGDDVVANSIIYLGVSETYDVIDDIEVIYPAQFNFNIAPNPARDLTNISFELEKEAEVQINVYNVTGALSMQTAYVQYSAGINQTELQVADLSTGIYFVQLNVDGKIVTRKMIIQ